MRFQILLLMTSKNEKKFKQHIHPYQKEQKRTRSKFHLKIMSIEVLYVINNNLQAKDDQEIYGMRILLHFSSLRVPFISKPMWFPCEVIFTNWNQPCTKMCVHKVKLDLLLFD